MDLTTQIVQNDTDTNNNLIKLKETTRKIKSFIGIANSNENKSPTIKCSTCLTWQNIYQIFEFLSNGLLSVCNNNTTTNNHSQTDEVEDTEKSMRNKQKKIADAALLDSASKCDNLVDTLTKIKQILRNPIDPSDTSDWDWEYKSSSHYKLLKLKLNLIVQINQLCKSYQLVLKKNERFVINIK
jgi:hypothetical protein